MRAFALLAPAVLVLAGCGGGTGSVTGTVTSKSKNKPVVSGNVMVMAPGGVTKYGEIGPDGKYTIDGVPAGPCKVTVSSPDPSTSTTRGDPAAGGRPEMPGREPAKTRPAAPPGWFPVDDKYGDPNLSGLSVDVKGGKAATTFDIALD